MAKIEEDPPAGVPEWVVTFGDMMSLLLTFFVLLFSMSEVKSTERFQAMAEAMRKQFGYATSRKSVTPGRNPPLNSKVERLGSEEWAARENLQNAREKRPQKARDRMRLWTTRPGDRPTLGTILLFEEVSSQLTPQHEQLLHDAAEQFRGKANKIEIRGHATGRPPPPGAAYKDDWDLAFARCYATMEYLVEKEGIDRKRIRLGVAGKNEPRHVEADPLLMAENSRVEVFILSEMLEEPGGAAR